MVYYVGIEENGKRVKKYMLDNIPKVNKKNTTNNEMQKSENLAYKESAVEEIELSPINHNLTD